jgi:WD40 repeat protein
VPRPENPLDPHAGPLADFAAGLHGLRTGTGLTYRVLAQRAHTSASALSQAANGQKVPTWEITAAFVQACGGDLDEWRVRWEELAAEANERAPGAAPSAAAGQAPSAAGTDEPQPPVGQLLISVASVEEFHKALKARRMRAGGPSLRDLEAAAQRKGHVLRRSTLSDMLGRTERLPPIGFVDAFLAACEVTGAELDDWHAAWARVAYRAQRQAEPEASRWSDTCPYPGLSAFGPDDAEIFYGREHASAQLAARVAESLNGTGMLLVTGPSGAGKSSLLRAGFLPALASGALGARAQQWPHLVMSPGAVPLQALACELASLAGLEEADVLQRLESPDEARLVVQQVLEIRRARSGTDASRPDRLVLVVDQFEEIFSACPDRAQREAFIRILEMMTTQIDGWDPPAVVILGARSDYFAHFAAQAGLVHLLQTGTFVVRALTESELRSTITGPAARAGLHIEEGLVDNILADLRSTTTSSGLEPSVLPLLSHALAQTWKHRESGTLTHRAYAATGGLARSIAASAEAAYAKLTPSQQTAAMTILRRLVTIPREGAITRRRAHLSELDNGQRTEDVSAALAALTDCRLVTVSEETAEIIHETVLRSWPRLNEWLESSRARAGVIARLADAAQEWVRNGGNPAFLYQGVRLAAVVEELDEPELSTKERAFVHASRRAARRRSRSRKLMAGFAIVMTIAAASAVLWAWSLRSTADSLRRSAISQGVASESQSTGDRTLAGLLSVASWRIAATSEARTSMIAAATRHGDAVTSPVFTAATGSATALALSPDGQTVAIASKDKEVHLWNISRPEQPRPMAVFSADGAVKQMTFSPDGGNLLVATRHHITVRDMATSAVRGSVLVSSSGPLRMAFSPGRQFLAVTDAHNLWILDTSHRAPRKLSRTTAAAGHSSIMAVAFSTGGRVLATAGSDKRIRLWDLPDDAAPHLAASFTGPTAAVNDLAFSPNGRMLAAGSSDGTARLWDVSRPARPRRYGVLSIHTGPVRGVAFSADGQTLATAGSDNTVRLWDAGNGRAVLTLVADTQGIARVVFSSDGRSLLTIGHNNEVQAWTVLAQADPAAVAKVICASAGRNLTRAEWNKYAKYVDYRSVCPHP